MRQGVERDQYRARIWHASGDGRVSHQVDEGLSGNDAGRQS